VPEVIAVAETCTDTVEGEVIADCATGYIAGDEITPSTTCPTGCTLTNGVDAVAAVDAVTAVAAVGIDFDCSEAGNPFAMLIPTAVSTGGSDFATCCEISGACTGNTRSLEDISCPMGSLRPDAGTFNCTLERSQGECSNVELSGSCCICQSTATQSFFYADPATRVGCTECPPKTRDDDNNPVTPCRPDGGFFYDGVSVVMCTPPEACNEDEEWGAMRADLMSDSSPVTGCAKGYGARRCSACVHGFYRKDGFCVECPDDALPFSVIVFLVVLLVLLAALVVDVILAKVQHVHDLVAPVVIVVTFFQTIALLMGMDLKYPEMLQRWIRFFNVFNFSLELGRPGKLVHPSLNSSTPL
jgi:hypothetical protein